MMRLSNLQFLALHRLSRAPSPAGFNDLPKCVGSQTVVTLADRGWAKIAIEITPEGRKALEAYLA